MTSCGAEINPSDQQIFGNEWSNNYSHSQECWEVPVCRAQWRSNAGDGQVTIFQLMLTFLWSCDQNSSACGWVGTHLPHQGEQGPQAQGLEECVRTPGALSIGSPDNMHKTRKSIPSDRIMPNSNIKLIRLTSLMQVVGWAIWLVCSN